MVTPPSGASEGKIYPVATIDGQNYSKEMLEIKYDHIPAQTVLLNAEAKVAHIELKKAGQLLGYVAGAGDDIPASLQQIGYKVDMLGEKDLTPENLAKYDAVIMGIRAYNTIDALAYRQTNLMEYTRKGGTLIVQYNTNFEYKVEAKELAPYSLNVSRDRVTDENAEVRFLKPEHKILNQPNKISSQDFSGWVQERGLYFPNDWDKTNFDAILSSNDPGEPRPRWWLAGGQIRIGVLHLHGLFLFRAIACGGYPGRSGFLPT